MSVSPFCQWYLLWRCLLLKTFAYPHVLFIKCIISTLGSHDEWQKMPAGSARKGNRRKQGGIFFCLFRAWKSNLLLATRAKESSSQQLRSERLQFHVCVLGVTGTSQARLGMAWQERVALLFSFLRAGFGWACFSLCEKAFLLWIDSPSSLLPEASSPHSFHPPLVVNQLPIKGIKKALSCSVCQFP